MHHEVKTMLIPDVFTKELKAFSIKTGKPITGAEQTKIIEIEVKNINQLKLF